MATLHKSKKSWWAYMRCVKWAQDKYIYLNTESKTTARVRLGEVNRMEKDIKTGVVDLEEVSWTWKNDEGITQIIQKSYKDAIKQWLTIKKTNVSSGTHKRYIVSLNAFMNVVGDVTPLSSITNQNIEDFKRYYSEFHTPCRY